MTKNNMTLVSRRSFLFTAAGVTLLGFSSEAKATTESFSPFAFAVVSDVHLVTGMTDSYKLLQESQLFLQDCIKTLNVEKLDFIVFCGDQVESPGKDDANWQLFLDVMQSCSAPWYFVLGEQDVSGQPRIEKMRTYGPDWKSRGLNTGKSYWSSEPVQGVHIVGLDTSRPDSPTGELSTEQLEWLRNDLHDHKHQFTIVFSHHPLLPPAPFDGGPPWDEYIVPAGAVAREILGTSPNVHLAISGHVHTNKIQQEKDVWYVSCPSLDVYPCAFRIFRVNEDGISVETYQVSYSALIKKAQKELAGSTLAHKYNSLKPQLFLEVVEGSALDQNAVMPIAHDEGLQPLNLRKKREKKPQRKS